MHWYLPESIVPCEHQWMNFAVAFACIEFMQWDEESAFAFSPRSIADGLANVQWPARLQELKEHKWLEYLPAGSEIWLDGGHNQAAGEVLTDWAKARYVEGGPQLHLICGMLEDKDAYSFLHALKDVVSHMWAVEIPDEHKSLDAHTLSELGESAGMPSAACTGINNALMEIGHHRKDDKPVHVLIAGSLYLAGAVLAELAE